MCPNIKTSINDFLYKKYAVVVSFRNVHTIFLYLYSSSANDLIQQKCDDSNTNYVPGNEKKVSAYRELYK